MFDMTPRIHKPMLRIPSYDGFYIYRILNTVNNAAYIGSTNAVYRRYYQHFDALASGKHHTRPLQNAWRVYGRDAFVFELLENVEDEHSLKIREQFWINAHGCTKSRYCYNEKDPIPYTKWPDGWFDEHVNMAAQMVLGTGVVRDRIAA